MFLVAFLIALGILELILILIEICSGIYARREMRRAERIIYTMLLLKEEK